MKQGRKMDYHPLKLKVNIDVFTCMQYDIVCVISIHMVLRQLFA